MRKLHDLQRSIWERRVPLSLRIRRLIASGHIMAVCKMAHRQNLKCRRLDMLIRKAGGRGTMLCYRPSSNYVAFKLRRVVPNCRNFALHSFLIHSKYKKNCKR